MFTENGMTYTKTDAWERAQVTVTLPSNGNRIRVYAALRSNAIGTVVLDAMQLEQGEAAGQYNLLQNPGLTRLTSAGAVADWTMSGNVGYEASAISGNSIWMEGTPSSQNSAYQTVQMAGSAGDTLVFGGTARGSASANCNNEEENNRRFGIEVQLYNGSILKQTEYALYNAFAVGTEQGISSSVKATTAFTSVRYKLIYNYEINDVLFDNLYLYKDAYGTSYKYDAEGRLIRAENDNGDVIDYTYTGVDLTKISYKKDAVEYDNVTYAYDSNHNLLTETTKNGIKTTYNYPTNHKGYPTSVVVTDADGSLQSRVDYAYTNNYNYLLKSTDAEGHVTQYTYNQYLGITTAVTDPNGNTTSYTYNAQNDALQSVSATVGSTAVSNSYTYNTQQLLSSVSHNGFSYGFTYDQFGRISTTSVAGQTLGAYAYNTDGTLASMTYGNGTVHSYAYDELDRLSSESYNGTTAFTYHYNATGQLGRHEDYENNVTWLYGYDLVGRLTDVQGSNNTRLEYSYDDHNNIQSYSAKVDNTVISSATYAYTDEGLLTTAELSATYGDYSYDYDSLNRLTAFSHDVNSDVVGTEYTYKAGTGSNTTGVVSNVEYRYDGYDFGPHNDYSYTYDANGNITSITDGSKYSTFTYDSLNQLTRENNAYTNKTVVYTYDNGGNILNKKYYAYTTSSSLGTLQDTVTYTYNSTWKDKLVAYDRQSITYDAIGNPLSYDGYTFTWQKGRQLATATGNGNTISYKYGADGLRASKTVNGVTTEYTYASGLLVQQTNGTNTLKFMYTADGVPRAVDYNGTDYYYLYNLQGDVISIYDRGGNTMVNYTYDSWGKLLSVTGRVTDDINYPATLGTANPFRYRTYYYDTETGYYYLQSRYYNPEIGRFLNADGYISTGQGILSYNMFAYCENNPV